MPDDEQDQHVAWCKYVPDERRGTRIKLCDSDAPGAFRVFRSAPAEKARALLIHEQSQRSMERDALQAEVQRLTAENEALRKDAGRYRWLAARFAGYDFNWMPSQPREWDGKTVAAFDIGRGDKDWRDISVAIDAAMAAQPGDRDE